MATIQELQEKYESLDGQYEMASESEIDPSCLLCFDYDFSGQDSEVIIDTDEFTAVCPWTGLPDYGTLVISYVPDKVCIELKSLKYYLMSYRNVGIVQEHVANRILNDLVDACKPVRMSINLDYKIRGGLHTTVNAKYERL